MHLCIYLYIKVYIFQNCIVHTEKEHFKGTEAAEIDLLLLFQLLIHPSRPQRRVERAKLRAGSEVEIGVRGGTAP